MTLDVKYMAVAVRRIGRHFIFTVENLHLDIIGSQFHLQTALSSGISNNIIIKFNLSTVIF